MVGRRHYKTNATPKWIESGDNFRLLAESSLTGVYMIHENLFHYVNPSFAKIFGYEVEEIVGNLGPMDLTAPEDRDLVAQNILKQVEGEIPGLRYSYRGLRKDGPRVHVEVHGSTIRYKSGHAIIGTLIDNTERAKAQEELREAEARYRRFFEEDIAANYITTPAGAILDCNDAFMHLFGFASKEELLKVNAASQFPMPRQRERFVELIREEKRLERHRAEYLRRDGKKIYVIENAIGEFDSAGNLTSIEGQLIDESNERQLEGELYQSQRLETIGALVGGIAHDFNNILGVIIGHVGLIEKRRSDPERFLKSMDAVHKATERGAHLTKQLLTFARKVEFVTESVRVNDIAEEIVALLKGTFPEKIIFSIQLDPGLPSIHADSNQLHQVLLNLCVNARDAMTEGGVLMIASSKVNCRVLNGRFHNVEAEEYVLLKVTDTGVGIDKETLSHIFEPFFTTKKGERGTGLGLSVVYGIMQAHHGFIDVQSEVGHGTKFSLYFPIPPQVVEAPPVPLRAVEELKGHGEMILAAEDEKPLIDFVRTTLEDNGYRVLLAADGSEAIKLYRKHRSEISLVLLDMGLPQMSGSEVISELKILNPAVKVIVTSGYLEPDLKKSVFEAGANGFLPKPFLGSELLEGIYRVLSLDV